MFASSRRLPVPSRTEDSGPSSLRGVRSLWPLRLFLQLSDSLTTSWRAAFSLAEPIFSRPADRPARDAAPSRRATHEDRFRPLSGTRSRPTQRALREAPQVSRRPKRLSTLRNHCACRLPRSLGPLRRAAFRAGADLVMRVDTAARGRRSEHPHSVVRSRQNPLQNAYGST